MDEATPRWCKAIVHDGLVAEFPGIPPQSSNYLALPLSQHAFNKIR
jgi:hypothetical protein